MEKDQEQPIVWHGQNEASNDCLILNAADTVAVALQNLKKGQLVNGVTLNAAIPKGHKFAQVNINEGDDVIKYAQPIGVANTNILAGDHVHTHNLEFRETVCQYEFTSRFNNQDNVQSTESTESTDEFDGYVRPNGAVGTRNFVAVISSVNCSATAAYQIAAGFDDEALAEFPFVDGVNVFAHGTGCGLADNGEGFDQLQRVFAGYATHPNVAAVLLVGLGCEVSQLKTLLDTYRFKEGPLLRTLNIQTSGGHQKTVEQGRALVFDMLKAANKHRRTPCSASHLNLALQCGGSDAWSGVTANPALGYAADLIVRQGGRVVLAETPEIYGAEHLLTRRATSETVGKDLLARINWWQDYVARNNGSLDSNPSPGNKLGGLTTILEKSLGAVAKSGTTSMTGVYKYAEPIDKPGFAFMDSPGYDPVSVTGQIASGCNVVAFTTGRGSTFGSKPAPCFKIATNTDMYQRMSDDMDVDAGRILSDGKSIQDIGTEIYQLVLNIASGQQSLSEMQNMGNNEFVPWQIGATM